MLGVLATLKVRAGTETEFEAAFAVMMKAVHENEPGNQVYELFRTENDQEYIVMETYDDEAAFEAHRNSVHMRDIRPTYAQFIDGRGSLQVLGSV